MSERFIRGEYPCVPDPYTSFLNEWEFVLQGKISSLDFVRFLVNLLRGTSSRVGSKEPGSLNLRLSKFFDISEEIIIQAECKDGYFDQTFEKHKQKGFKIDEDFN